jgi:hypothetical protein
MTVLVTTFVLLLVALVIHVGIWRIHRPGGELGALSLIFGAVLLGWLVAIAPFTVSTLQLLRVVLLYLPTAFSYILTYPAIGADSPTISLMQLLAKSPDGVASETIASEFVRWPFIRARLATLLKSGQVVEQGDRYVASKQVSLIFRIILGYRRIYGGTRGG